MVTFELANYPKGTTTWEVYLDGVPLEKSISQRQIVSNITKGELVVTLYQDAIPTWRWVGHLPENIAATQKIQVNPLEEKICLIQSQPLVKDDRITNILKVGAVLGVVGLVLGKSK